VATYKVIFLGLTVAGPEEEDRLLTGLKKKFNLTPERAERLFQRVPVVVKKGISRAEMERYVKAFEEIGGKVKVEEVLSIEPPAIRHEPPESAPKHEATKPEPPPVQGPLPGYEAPPKLGPPPEKGPHTGKTITCPQCGFEQLETDECSKCGVIISKFLRYQEMAKIYEGQVRESVREEKDSPAWESGEGFVRSFFITTKEVLFSPTQFFKKVTEGQGYLAPLIYGVICGVIGGCAAALWQWLFASRFIPAKILSMIPFFSIFLILFLIALPFMIAFSILVGSGITHLCLMIVGGNRKGFESTFRVLSYAYSGNLFGIIPFIGSTIGGIYTLVLTIFGVRESHGISTGKTVLAVLLPLIILVGVIILFVMILPFLFRSSGFLGGARI
jgi:hypothetical protein